MRMQVYNFLVNRHDGIRIRYHRLHDGAGKKDKILSYVYLLWLNFCYYVLFCRFLDKAKAVEIYEKKRLPVMDSESAVFLNTGVSVDGFVECLSGYDIISFDLFDTLIFRPFSEPGDLFYFLGAEFGLLDFKRIRMEQEALARVECRRDKGHYEVTFADIWKHIEQDVGINAERGMAAEQRLEAEFCYANPFMLEVFHQLQNAGKKIIVISDMYLPGAFLCELLEKNGYGGISGLYVSSEYGKSKRDGKLYELVKEREAFAPDTRLIHVGDNECSDVKMGRQSGFDTKYYPNINKNAQLFRPYDMSPMVGGAYRGIVDNHIYCGIRKYSMEYEYGFIYGGLFVLGYCSFIYDFCKKNSVDKILFLSRDGDILKQAYDFLYPDENTEYVYWSRKAASKLEAGYDKQDYFRRFVFHKVNQGYRIGEVLHSMELDFLAEELGSRPEGKTRSNPENKTDTGQEERQEGILDNGGARKEKRQEGRPDNEGERKAGTVREERGLGKDEQLTDKNAPLLKRYIEANWNRVLEKYREQNEAAKSYYETVLAGVKKAAVVDIGWAGSGAMVLRHLVSEEWGISCELTGLVAGTNTIYNAEPEASESFLQSGQMAAYLYSQRHNRDLLKKHDLNKNYNVFWELLLSSAAPQFKGFYKRKAENAGSLPVSDGYADIEFVFGKYDANQEGIREIQRGILDFVKAYREHFSGFSYMFHISGRDAYAPMLIAASYKERYLRTMEQKFGLEMNVN